jgi:hypothetical protein
MENDMKKLIILAATATIAMTGAAFADSYSRDSAYDHSPDYRDRAWSRNIETTQPSGGKVADELAAPTRNISGSVTGAANMNGPLRNGQPFDEGFWLRNSSPFDD